MDREIIINKTVEFVKISLANAEGGHDRRHIYRVWKTAKNIAQTEKVDMLIVELGALLHDIADSKFYDGDHREYFEHIFNFVGKSRFEFVKGMMHRYAKDFCPEARIEEKLTERQKILYEFE